MPTFVEFAFVDGGGLDWFELSQGFFDGLFHAFGTTIVCVGEEFAVCGGYVETLRGAVFEVVTGSLAGDLAIVIALGILLAALIRLIDGDGNETGLQQFNDLGIGESRLTVEHSIVSRTAQRVPVHGPDEDRFLLFGRSSLGLEQGNFPGNGPPRFVW